MSDITIKKRGGEVENFSLDKLLVSIGKAGISMDQAKIIAEKIVKWTKEGENKNSVSSSQLRDKVIELMSVDFPAEADSYAVYKK